MCRFVYISAILSSTTFHYNPILVETTSESLGETTMWNATYSAPLSTPTSSAPLWLFQSVLAWRSVRSRMRSYTQDWLRCVSWMSFRIKGGGTKPKNFCQPIHLLVVDGNHHKKLLRTPFWNFRFFHQVALKCPFTRIINSKMAAVALSFLMIEQNK